MNPELRLRLLPYNITGRQGEREIKKKREKTYLEGSGRFEKTFKKIMCQAVFVKKCDYWTG
jgi:hypothetical protein